MTRMNVAPPRSARAKTPSKVSLVEQQLLDLLPKKWHAVATDAALVLASVGHPAGLAKLGVQARTGERDTAERALRALAESRLPAALRHIVGGFSSRNLHVRIETFYALAKLGTPQALAAMEHARFTMVLGEGPGEDVNKLRFLNALGSWSGFQGRIDPVLDRYIADGTPEQRRLAELARRFPGPRPPSEAVMLQRAGRTEAAVGSLIRNGHSSLAAAAARTAAELGYRRFAPAIADALRKGGHGVLDREALRASLAKLEGEGLPEIARRMARTDHSAAVRSLARTLKG